MRLKGRERKLGGGLRIRLFAFSPFLLFAPCRLLPPPRPAARRLDANPVACVCVCGIFSLKDSFAPLADQQRAAGGSRFAAIESVRASLAPVRKNRDARIGEQFNLAHDPIAAARRALAARPAPYPAAPHA